MASSPDSWSSAKVRSTFIDFFKDKKAHTFVPSSPVVPHDDPTLLFANAGMNQYKPIFLGQVDPKSEQAKLKRAVNSQKCIRAGGKHNDLDDVGKDTYHHTFFEMLGNWSFGDYFKEEAISWAWELLTEVYGLDKNRLYASYFEGHKESGLEPDTEAKNIWLRFLPESHVLPFGMKENFWEMGDTGPCGPCSEIHFDRIGNRDASSLVNADDPTVIEIWNNVFIQFNREADRSLRSLPSKHVDTGMGFERLCSVVQNQMSNYDTDVFQPLFEAIQKITGFPRGYTKKLGPEDEGGVDMAYRVIADHARTLTFAINDGALPSAEGRGYVLRRILRRAVRYGNQKLKAPPGFFQKLVPVVIDVMSDAFPELKKNPEHIQNIIANEETTFERTLVKGLIMFKRIHKKTVDKGEKIISARNLHLLYTTYGFPVDLIQILADEEGMKTDEKGFSDIMLQQKKGNRENFKKGINTKLTLDAAAVAQLGQELDVTATEDQFKYESQEVDSQIKAIWNGSEFVEAISENVEGTLGLIFDRTNFYAEQGGQIHDTGFVTLAGQTEPSFHVTDVQSFGGYVLHMGEVSKHGHILSVGDTVRLRLEHERRSSVASNHTSTHMVNLALRNVLGTGIEQKGSLVVHDRFRFDYSHNKAPSTHELTEIDKIVAELITQEMPVYTKVVSLADAKKIKGLRAVFGEVYPDPVRVVSVGKSVDDLLAHPENDDWLKLSIEFCGGTHLQNTKEATAFAVIEEGPVAAGVRRIICVTGKEAQNAITNVTQVKERIKQLQSKTGKELQTEYQALKSDIQEKIVLPAHEKQLMLQSLAPIEEKLKATFKDQKGLFQENANKFVEEAVQDLAKEGVLHYIKLVEVGGYNDMLSEAVKSIREKCPSVAVLAISVGHEEKNRKASVVANVPSVLVQKGLKANEWASKAAVAMGGKGGGKPEVAQGAGPQVDKVEAALAEAEKHVKESLKL